MADVGTEVFHISRPLEKYRELKVMSVGEFAAFLGITEQTYRRMLREPEKVRPATRRQVLERLDLPSPVFVNEFAPSPTQDALDRVLAAYEEGDRLGGVALDPDTGKELGEVWSMDGVLIRRYDPETEEPWPDMSR